MPLVIALLVLLALPAVADARQITVRIRAKDGQIFLSPIPLEERFRVTLPGTGRVTRHLHDERRWVDGRCRLRLWGMAYARGDRDLDESPLRRRYTVGTRTVYLHAKARGCAKGTVARVMRSVGLLRTRRPCDASGKTAAENDQVRAYAERKRLVVCFKATRFRFDAGAFAPAGGNACGLEFCALDRPVVAGSFIAYASESSGRRAWGGDIHVRAARTGRELHAFPAGLQEGCGNGFSALVLREDGTPAWIVRNECHTGSYELRTEAGVVSAGPGIDPGSLRLAGDTITWVQDGVPRQSRIDSPRIARAMTSFWISLVPS